MTEARLSTQMDESYVRQLEDALAVLWEGVEPDTAEAIQEEFPDLAAFCRTVRSVVGERESQW